ncbi:glycosyltransferase family 4 protein [Occallatibacter riparius]|uniref:Glycosyltransferase family 4 protein n=1 Tax=Occallatibacter riparius TaxID=1002689 RepID=A0A9J7BM62_9BACT|nr:glycosyltransferase family 4 protein [Occallatibacter riparius]UWZ83719.1 glycosyltransferase family 4 protein [Occallatibacter riparius]
MKILHVIPDFPFPPDNGARADVWSRLVAMKSLGYSVDVLVMAQKRTPSPEQISAVRDVVDSLHFIEPKPRYKCIVTRLPTYIARSASLIEHRLTSEYDVTLMEAEHTFAITQNPTLRTKRTVVRVHNDEIAWLREAMKLEESTLRKQILRLELARLKPFVRHVHQRVDQLWFISEFEWQAFATSHPDLKHKTAWLPPSLQISQTHRRIDPDNKRVLFVGNLYTSLNRDALRWYLEHVHPVLLNIPGYEFIIAGSTHGREVASRFADHLKSFERCVVHMDMPDPTELYDDCTIFVNPMQAGAGVKMKSIHAIERRIPVVSTSVGNEGTGFQSGEHLKIADTAEEFTSAIRKLLNDRSLREVQAERAYDHLLTRYDAAKNISQLADGLELLQHDANSLPGGQTLGDRGRCLSAS